MKSMDLWDPLLKFCAMINDKVNAGHRVGPAAVVKGISHDSYRQEVSVC